MNASRATGGILALLLTGGVVWFLAAPQAIPPGAPSPSKQSAPNAVTEMEARARHGDTEAAVALALIYVEGRGVKQDLAKALKWYRRAAEDGDAVAQVQLGGFYYRGQGVAQNSAEAVRWWLKAAEQGDARTQFFLGWIHANGLGVETNRTEAERWFQRAAERYRRAAEEGHPYSQFMMAQMCDNGWGLKRDRSEAGRWYRKAAESMPADAATSVTTNSAAGQDGLMGEGVVPPWLDPSMETDPIPHFNDPSAPRSPRHSRGNFPPRKTPIENTPVR